MGDRVCYRVFCPDCEAPVAITDDACPDCGSSLPDDPDGTS